MPSWLIKIAPIFILLAVVGIVIARLPSVDGINHSADYKRRRVMNWLPLGLTYAFLYMGRYNLKVSKLAFGEMPNSLGDPMMGNDDFGWIFGVGTAVYGCSFLINGPLTDKYGGKLAILMGAGGSALMNGLMGLCTYILVTGAPADGVPASDNYLLIADNFRAIFSVLYALNMYFQAFGAVSVVKVNAPWFHVRERGVFGAIFGILISLGVYFAFDWGYAIVKNLPLQYVFWIPTTILGVLWFVCLGIVRNSPAEAGFKDFDLGDGKAGDEEDKSVVEVFRLMLTNPIIMTIAAIEFCSGFLRQAIMQWYREFAKQTDMVLHLKEGFVYDNWGLLLCCAGIMGGVCAGIISDYFFQSRRGPVAAILYAGMLVGSIVLLLTYNNPYFITLIESTGEGQMIISTTGMLVVLMSMFVIGVHGMLSGTASMDFGGRKNVGVAVGIIDGFVYAGTALMSFTYAFTLPEAELDPVTHKYIGESTNPDNWTAWPGFMIPFALFGLLLSTRVWNAKPKSAKPPAAGGVESQTEA